MKARTPRLYFSLRSPYSWLAIRRLREQVPDLGGRFECIPFWDPDAATLAGLQARGGEFHYVQMSRAKHLYMLLDTKRLAERAGAAMAWPVDRDPWWERAHLGWLAARRDGREWEFYDALVAARWGRGEDVCDPAVLTVAAAEAGLDPDRVLAAVDDPELRAEGVDCLYRAYLDDVFGIPYLKWGRHRFWGVDRVDAFLDAWQPDGPAAPAPGPDLEGALVGGPAYEVDTCGGCG